MACRVGCADLQGKESPGLRGRLHSCCQERCNSLCLTEQLLARKGFIPSTQACCPCRLYTSHIIDVVINSPQQLVREGVREHSLYANPGFDTLLDACGSFWARRNPGATGKLNSPRLDLREDLRRSMMSKREGGEEAGPCL